MRIRVLGLAVAGCLAFGSVAVAGPDSAPTSNINGTVRLIDHGPTVPQIHVTAVHIVNPSAPKKYQFSDKTVGQDANGKGQFQFSGLPPGRYEITFSAQPNYPPQKKSIYIRKGESVTLDLPLVPVAHKDLYRPATDYWDFIDFFRGLLDTRKEEDKTLPGEDVAEREIRKDATHSYNLARDALLTRNVYEFFKGRDELRGIANGDLYPADPDDPGYPRARRFAKSLLTSLEATRAKPETEARQKENHLFDLALQGLREHDKKLFVFSRNKLKSISENGYYRDLYPGVRQLGERLLALLPAQYVPGFAYMRDDGTWASDPSPFIQLMLMREGDSVRDAGGDSGGGDD